MARFILASQSPRRRQLLGLCGYPFDSITAYVDESSVSDPDPVKDCIRTARLKAEAIAKQFHPSPDPRTIILAADTIVTLDGQILGKPRDSSDAKRMLSTLRDRVHFVHTGVTILDMETGQEILDSHSAKVKLRSYSAQEVSTYIASGDPLDKAGAYAIQHPIFRPVESLEGCYLGVMGLSICHLVHLLEQLDLPFKADLNMLHDAHHGFRCSLYDNIAQKHGK